MKLHALDPLLYPLKEDEDILYAQSLFIDRFYELITKEIQPPYAISVDGRWGTGKTSLMTMIQHKLETAGYPVFWFNPWEYRQTQSVVLSFLQCLAAKYQDILKNQVATSSWKILRVLLELGIDVGVTFITKGLAKGVLSRSAIENKFKEIEKGQQTTFENYQNTIEILKKEFVELTSVISKKHDHKPIVIFFDDLDRCLPDDTIQLLEAVKNLFVTPNCKGIFICGIDTNIAKQFISTHYRGIEEMFAINYFRKIFNLTISMPYSSDIYTLLLKYVEELYHWDTPNDKEELAKQIYILGLQTKISSIRKYLNVIANFYVFLKFNPDYKFNVDGDFVVRLLILKEAWQPIYENLITDALQKHPINMSDLIKGLIQSATENGKRLLGEQEDFLRHYLGDDSPFRNEDMAEWLVKYPALA